MMRPEVRRPRPGSVGTAAFVSTLQVYHPSSQRRQRRFIAQILRSIECCFPFRRTIRFDLCLFFWRLYTLFPYIPYRSVMVAHRHIRRQTSDPLPAISASGIASNGITVDDVTTTATTLAYDSSATTTDVDSGVSVVFETPSSTAKAKSTTSSSSQPTVSDAATTKEIPIGTVIGACVGAFAGAVLLIVLGIWIYKCAIPKAKSKDPAPTMSASRNARGEHERSRSRLENWDKLVDDPQSEGKYHMKEVDGGVSVAPMEKLTMFNKSPSVRTAYTHTTEEPPHFDLEPHPFSPYHSNLAKELASTDVKEPIRPFAGRADSAAMSWNSTANESFLSLRSAHMSGSMSPSLDMAIPTPPLTSSEPHRWESAEVVNFDDQQAKTVDLGENPFNSPTERRRSFGNPFFNAQGSSVPVRSKTPDVPRIPRSKKGKERAVNPFSDVHASDPVYAHTSTTSSIENDLAIHSLIAALEGRDDVSDAHLRAPSLQASLQSSAVSVYSGDESAANSFPSRSQ
ncbi:uncharacterized protein BT62DRAFT_1000341 [Guyanagaster necrorhizus]|uniref:Uncharacterized protein n=1 Tax=Guyanagaster necrorhizus TaxID=856835 RepID=A0A9P7W2Z2_9AGAR|nr:uncharacterized protein BT62DRAFT_1000341 [Guyanagaster necrorhizus MCA 3950]KAG7451109.1 hypothetical protein BT62DRAFT_1000341 [Guyanagaster necrorhizus MCA 3950]